ncbi:MAG: RNA-binding protein [Chitinispirillales bacterium]|nr:RNA-binding protein [Chitinispirillales bacterium]
MATVFQTIYVGNLPYYITEREVRKLFRPYEPVHSIAMITDKEGYPQGYAFVELGKFMAEMAIGDLNNKKICGRNLRISKALGRDNVKAG